MSVFGMYSTVLDREGSKRRKYLWKFNYLQKVKSLQHEKNIFSLFLKDLFLFIFYNAAMGIHGNIWQCLRKCHPILVLRRQIKCLRKDFHVYGIYFHILRGVFLTIFEKFNFIYNSLTSSLLQKYNSFSSCSSI